MFNKKHQIYNLGLIQWILNHALNYHPCSNGCKQILWCLNIFRMNLFSTLLDLRLDQATHTKTPKSSTRIPISSASSRMLFLRSGGDIFIVLFFFSLFFSFTQCKCDPKIAFKSSASSFIALASQQDADGSEEKARLFAVRPIKYLSPSILNSWSLALGWCPSLIHYVFQ